MTVLGNIALLDIGLILGGFVFLIWGADRFIEGASGIACNFGVSPLIIGLTIVGLGTSAPEVLVSIMASLQGNPQLAIGNAIGSNIANIALILGATSLFIPLFVKSAILRREYPVMLAVTLFASFLLFDGELSRNDGIALLMVLVAVILLLIWLAKTAKSDSIEAEFKAEIHPNMNTKKALFWFVVGLITLLVSSRALVVGAVHIATDFGVSDLVIGLTIIAVGTSLPELAASISSALKKEYDIAIGNVIGSNIYNIAAVLAVPGLIAPGTFLTEIIHRDVPVMLVLTALFFLFGYGKKGQINRLEGAFLLSLFIAYQGWIFISISGASSL